MKHIGVNDLCGGTMPHLWRYNIPQPKYVWVPLAVQLERKRKIMTQRPRAIEMRNCEPITSRILAIAPCNFYCFLESIIRSG
jgi:hypothetical protein